MSTIKLSRIVFEGPIQIAGMTVREYVLLDGSPSRYDAHLHGDLQCVVLRDPTADATVYIPLRLVRSMEAYDKHNIPAASSYPNEAVVTREDGSSYRASIPCASPDERGKLHRIPAASSSSEGMLAMQDTMCEQLAFKVPPPEPSSDEAPRRRGRPRTKHLSSPDGSI